MDDYVKRVREIWPAGMQDEAVAVASNPSRTRSASHSTTNRGQMLPPRSTYENALRIGEAIVKAMETDAEILR